MTFEEQYHEIALSCFRYLGFTSLEQVDRLTIPEYHLMMEAAQLREADQHYWAHWQAFLNFAVRAKKRAGKNKEKPVYRDFKKFFEYEAVVEKIRNHGKRYDRFSSLKEHLRKEGANHRRQL